MTDELAPGTLITDRLVVVRRIGKGGLGDVYEVDHKVTHHRRAVKVMHARHCHDDQLVDRFLREASAAGRIRNPHIVETFDAGRMADGTPYLVMELLTGKGLDEVMRANGRLDVDLACGVIHQVCVGIQAAHEADIVHRDLKPENLFLTQRDGRAFVKVLDFGVSKFLEGTDPAGDRPRTRPGDVIGTPVYMAPEQLNDARNVDPRCDVYSLGIMLYEMLAGRVPYSAGSLGELWRVVLRGDHPPLSVVDGTVPAALSELVSRAIHSDAARRVPSAKALGEKLEPFARGRPVSLLLEHEVVPGSRAKKVGLRPLAAKHEGVTRTAPAVTVARVPEGRAPTEPGTATVDVADLTLVVAPGGETQEMTQAAVSAVLASRETPADERHQTTLEHPAAAGGGEPLTHPFRFTEPHPAHEPADEPMTVVTGAKPVAAPPQPAAKGSGAWVIFAAVLAALVVLALGAVLSEGDAEPAPVAPGSLKTMPALRETGK
ncbi:MAG: serine/threonine protein kinase [Myxococcaceae bacterium]|nr:serine/threonine protein kinase [Myxococcaceae bacterium]